MAIRKNDIKTLQELRVYSFEDLQYILEVDKYKCNKIIKSLIDMNLLRKKIYSKDDIELENLIDIDKYVGVKNIYSFKYVGIILVEQIYLFIYPKYINNIENDVNNKYNKFMQIIEVIKKYNSKKQEQNIIGDEDNINFNLLSFTIELIQNYYENGLYKNTMSIIEENGLGNILWEKTIDEQNAYFSNSTPIYLDFFTEKSITDEEDIFRRLHRCILSRCCEKIEGILDILKIDIINISSEYLIDFGSKDYLQYIINQEINRQYITQNQYLLKMMLIYLNQEDFNQNKDEISFFGTNSFNLVWEDVCSTVMGNCLDMSIKQLKLKPYKNLTEQSLLKDIIIKPKFVEKNSNKQTYSKKTLIPDLIVLKENKLLIYDAKYYNIQFKNGNFINNFGVNDISKQYLYELAYKEFANYNNLEIEQNVFLVPTDDIEEKYIGDIKFDIFNSFNLKDIGIILKPCQNMFNEYLK